MVVIPVKNDPSHEFSIVLDGVSYVLRFIWNTRFEYWAMNISDRDGNSIVDGIRVVSDYGLTEQLTVNGLPEGDFFVGRTDESFDKIGIDSFSNDEAVLVFLTKEEIELVL